MTATRTAVVEVDGTDLAFPCAFGEPILDAALAAGIELPHQCRGASCGTCKCEVIDGEVDHGWSLGLALGDDEKLAGRCLACQATPRSARVRIRPLAAPSPAGEPIAEVAATVLANRAETPRVRRLVLAIERGARFAQRPGASVELVLPGIAPHRRYSLAHPPDDAGLVELWIALHPGGAASAVVHDGLRPGGRVGLRGPFAGLALPAGDGDVVAMAGGTGLAPVLSVLEAAFDGGLAVGVLLMLSVRAHDEILGLDRLERLARRHPGFSYEIACTDAPSPLARHGETLDRVLPRRFGSLRGARLLVSGSPGFVDACTGAALALGARREDVATDRFVPAAR